MEVSDLKVRSWNDKGFSGIDYRVMAPDLRIICTTKDLAKAERIAEQCGGTIHSSRESQ
jgi:hypothetical protein